MNYRSVSHEPTAGARSDQRHATPAAGDRRSVPVVERSSRGQASSAKAQPLLA